VSRGARVGLLLLLGIGFGAFLATRPPRPRFGEAPETGARGSRTFSGVCLEAGVPARGVLVRLVEHFGAEPEVVATFTTGDDGAFRLVWRPEATEAADEVRLLFRKEDRTRAVRAAPDDLRAVELPPLVRTEGVALDPDGEPLAEARVVAALAGDPFSACETRTDAGGRFSFDDFPEAARLELLLLRDGLLRRAEGRFRAGDRVTLRGVRGRDVSLRLADPSGRPAAGVRARLVGPIELREALPAGVSDAEGRVRLPDASDGGYVFVECRSPAGAGGASVLPAVHAVAPHEEASVPVWPARRVELAAWDALTREGVRIDRLYGESVDLLGDAAEWWAGSRTSMRPLYEPRVAPGAGKYRLLLPRCALRLSVEAKGFDPGEISIGAEESRAAIPMAPSFAPRASRVTLAPEPPPGARSVPLPLLVVDRASGWHAVVDAGPEGAEVETPPGRKLEVASIGAREGFWAPPREFVSPDPGGRARIPLALREAIRVPVRATAPGGGPLESGEAILHDLTQESLARPLRAPVRGGEALLWSRPLRGVRVEVRGGADCFVFAQDLSVERTEARVEARLLRAGSLRARVLDPGGRPIPFAEALLYGPAAQGGPPIAAAPTRRAAAGDGALLLGPLEEGEAALEIRAPGFRARRFALVRVGRGSETDLGEVRLLPAPRVEGRLKDPSGAPLQGIWVGALPDGFARIPAPGGSLTVYDLASLSSGSAATNAEGRFSLLDESAGRSLLAVFDHRGAFALPLPEGGDAILPPPAALLLDDIPGPVQGVYAVLERGHAARIQADPPLSLRPLPVPVRAGPIRLFVLLRDGRHAVAEFTVGPDEAKTVRLQFRR